MTRASIGRKLATVAIVAMGHTCVAHAQGSDTAGSDAVGPASKFYQGLGENMLVSRMLGSPLYFESDGGTRTRIGVVEDLIARPNGDIHAAVVDVGAYLGTASKRVAMDIGDLAIEGQPDQPEFVLGIDPAMLENAPTFSSDSSQDPLLQGGSGADDPADRGRAVQSDRFIGSDN